jgi:hypothetical protein
LLVSTRRLTVFIKRVNWPGSLDSSVISDAVAPCLAKNQVEIAKMDILKLLLLLAVFFSLTQNALATGAESTCGGVSTVIFSSANTDLSICHAPHTQINRSQPGKWQECNDAVIQITDKKKAKTEEFADCGPTGKKQFMVRGNIFMLRHFYTEYPGFEMKPLLIESINLTTGKKKYKFIKKLQLKEKRRAMTQSEKLMLQSGSPLMELF